MENLPFLLSALFIALTFISIFYLYLASSKSVSVLVILIAWILVQSIIVLSGFYTITQSLPPRFVLLIVPPLLTILLLFVSKKGRPFIDALDLKTLTLFHWIRIPVELGLYWLCIYKTIPVLMTFEGRNLDIISGITAPIIYYFGFIKKTLSIRVILTWNFICLALLFNIVINAVLSVQSPFQQFAFDQPNIAILYFPFMLLPACIVPIVLFAHLVSVRQLMAR